MLIAILANFFLFLINFFTTFKKFIKMKHFMLPFAGLLFLCYSCTNEAPYTEASSDEMTEIRAMADDSCGYAGLIQKKISSCDSLRYYYIQLPESYDHTVSYPLLLVFHGKGSGLKNKACVWKERIGDWVDEHKFIAVYGRSYNDNHWYVDDACLTAVDEICYVETILNEMKASHNIIEEKIYAMGTSNGAGLCYSLVREMDDFAAIATFAAYKWEGYSFASVPKIPLMQIHGTEDGTIPYTGGTLFCLNFDNAYAACGDWALHNNCLSPLEPTLFEIGSYDINRSSWCSKKVSPVDGPTCKKCKKEVLHYKLNGIPHTIYDSISMIPGYKELINDHLFSFFKRHKL